MLVAVDANLRGGYPSARVFCTCYVVIRERAVAACAVADGPGAPSVEGKQYCVHFVLDLEQGGHTLLRRCA